ncbi:MAG: hypothetical protein ACLFOY_15735 [Desulfatibacillaceae bacterium]
MKSSHTRAAAAALLLLILATALASCRAVPSREHLYQHRQRALHDFSFYRTKAESAVANAKDTIDPKSSLWIEMEAMYNRAREKGDTLVQLMSMSLDSPRFEARDLQTTVVGLALDVERLEEFVMTGGYAKDFTLYAESPVALDDVLDAAQMIWEHAREPTGPGPEQVRRELERLRWKDWEDVLGRTSSFHGEMKF